MALLGSVHTERRAENRRDWFGHLIFSLLQCISPDHSLLVFPAWPKAPQFLRFSEISSPYLMGLLGWKPKKWAGCMKKSPSVLELKKCSSWILKCAGTSTLVTPSILSFNWCSKAERTENRCFIGQCSKTQVKWVMWVWLRTWLFTVCTLCVFKTVYGKDLRQTAGSAEISWTNYFIQV